MSNIKDNITLDKCKECYKRSNSCCVTQPLFTNSELAKVYYETEIFNDMKLQILPVGTTHFVLMKQEWNVKGDFDINSRACLFLDKTGSCSIYDRRPSICVDYGEVDHLPCYAKDMSIEELSTMDEAPLTNLVNDANKIADKYKSMILDSRSVFKNIFKIGLKTYTNVISKQDKQDLKFNVILYYIIHNVEHIDYTKSRLLDNNITKSYDYELVAIVNGFNSTISSIRNNVITCSDTYKKFGVMYKKMSKYIMSKPYVYHKAIVEVINDKLSELDIIDIPKDKFKLLTIQGDEQKELLNIISTLLALYYLVDNNDTPKYITKYTNVLDLTKLRYSIYANVSYLVNGDESSLLVDGEYKESKDISLFNTKLKTDFEKEILGYLEDITILKLDTLINK